jgi:hypothetical protein
VGRVTGRLLVGKMKEKRLLGRTRCSFVENVIINLKEIGWERGMD